ncbi:phage major capsid protein [Rhodopirellula sp. MGV]|uniref:phage major capsid protein n=1 Tax=Rhodopirellula sp. MGV TaxID=2023130 RepID=UPI000B960264|nr:phage major capsid protein [Rhodopirellula sp. MGV]OYP34140.1 phage major capsid protein [Rhodopirellula sp. MGV]PNY33576.1 phage major capsid protein [Rhodopirellula baltica]
MIKTLNSKELREEIRELEARALAIGQLAEAEDRDLTAREQAEFDSICGKGDPNSANYVPGEIDNLQQDLVRAVNRDKVQAKILSDRVASGQVRFASDENTRSEKWQVNAQGNRYAILDKQDRFADYVSTPCKDAFGHAVLAYAFGPSRDTPEGVVNLMREGSGAAGGYTVPEQMLGEVIDLARAKSVLMDAGVRTVAMTSDSMNIPTLESDVDVELRGEGEAISFSEVTIGQRKLSTRTAGSITKCSRELWEDSPTLLAAQLQNWMATQMAKQIDSIGLNGYTSKPHGFFGTEGINSTDSIGDIDWVDVSSAVTRIRVNNHEPTSFVMHPTVHDALFNIETGDGENSARGWLEAPPTIRGKQYLPTTNCPAGKMAIGDFSKYFMGVRTGIVIEVSREAGNAFQNHEVYIKATARFDFVSVDDTAFEILTGITVS